MVSSLDNLAFRNTVRQTVPPRLEKLTDEYDSHSNPLRTALNTVLAASAEAWPEALFTAGLYLKLFDLSDPVWGFPCRPAWDSSDEVWGKYAVLELARVAAAGDRDEFDRLRDNLRAEPGVAACAAAGRTHFSLCLMERSRRESRSLVLENARAALREVGLALTSACFTILSRVRCQLTPRVEDALRHWIDPDASPVWAADGQLPPLGYRCSRLGNSQAECGLDQPDDVPAEEDPVGSPLPKADKKSTERGEGRVKLIAALTAHHRYADGSALHQEPVGNNALARAAGVDKATASDFFKKDFGGYGNYRVMCKDATRLVCALKLLNGEFRPRELNVPRSDAWERPEED